MKKSCELAALYSCTVHENHTLINSMHLIRMIKKSLVFNINNPINAKSKAQIYVNHIGITAGEN